MKKKLLAAAVLAAMTLSTASVFAAPDLSGDAKIEYVHQENAGTSLTNRVRLNADAAIDDTFYVHARAVVNNDIKTGDNGDVTFDQAYIGANLKGTDIKVGRQSLFLGKGMLMDGDGLSGANITTALDGIKLSGFYGKADGNEEVRTAEMTTAFSNVNFGASYLKEADNKYWGINLDTKIMDNAVLNVEYVKNNEAKATGYIAEVKVGDAAHKGEFDYAVSYRDVEANAVSKYSTDANYSDSKGFRISANYKVTDNATLNLKQDLADDNAGNIGKNRTDVTFSVNF